MSTEPEFPPDFPSVEELMSLVREDPVPDEATEAFARALRLQYLALVRQNFTEDQALQLVGGILLSAFNSAWAEQAEKRRREGS